MKHLLCDPETPITREEYENNKKVKRDNWLTSSALESEIDRLVIATPHSVRIGVNHHLSGWMSISNSWLNNNWLDGTTIEACKGLHLLGYLEVALHVLRKVARVHRRLLRCGYFPHLALRYLLVELVEICHDSSLLRISQGQRYDNLMKQTNILQKKN